MGFWNMPKLSEIIEPLADILGIPARSVNVWAMILRKSGLITKGGRGMGGAEMRPSDVTNLLLAAMVGGEATAAGETVAFVRGCAFSRVEEKFDCLDEKDVSVNFFDKSADFGGVLDRMIATMMRGEPVVVDTGLPVTNITVTVAQPTAFGANASIWIDEGDREWTLRFHRNGKAFEGASPEMAAEIARRLKVPAISVEASVNTTTLFDLADLLASRQDSTNHDRPS